MGGFKDQGVELGGVGSTSRRWRLVGLGVEMGGFKDQGVELEGVGSTSRRWRLVGLGVGMGRFRGGDGWV